MANSKKIDIDERFFVPSLWDGVMDLEDDLVLENVRSEITGIAKYLTDNVRDGRELSLAVTKLEEALMWAEQAMHKG